MSLDHTDIEIIERLIFKCGDDIATSIARSFERLEERIDASEARICSRIVECEDRIEASRQDASDLIGEMRDEMRDTIRLRDM